MENQCRSIFRIQKAICGIAAAVFILQSIGCGSSPGTHGKFGELNSLIITPQTSGIALGQTVQFKAMGIFSDGSNEDVTGAAVWTSSDPKIASMSSTGLATSLSV